MVKQKRRARHLLQSIRLLVVMIFILTLLSLILAACGSGGGGSADESDSQTSELEEEKAIVEQAIQDFMERTGRTEITSREKPRPIGPWDTDAPFKGDIPFKLPTKYRYAWDEKGNITEVAQVDVEE